MSRWFCVKMAAKVTMNTSQHSVMRVVRRKRLTNPMRATPENANATGRKGEGTTSTSQTSIRAACSLTVT